MKCTREYRMQFDEKAKEIVGQMTLEEKVEMMAGHCKASDSMGGGGYNAVPYPFGGCKRLGVPELKFCDGPRGVVSGHSTCFPVSMACGATFDRELEYEIGRAIGREVLGNGGNYFGGVCMNIPYHPGAGRSQECFGEDSYHMGEMAKALMEGVQEENVIACAKHFAFNSMERSRFKVDMDADKRTEMEVFFPHFRKVIDAGCASVMNAYNLYKGKKCGHNPYLLRETLKDGWGFDGFVISDFVWGVKSAAGGISGGCDVEMHFRQKYTLKKVKKAMENGQITEEMLDDACIRIARTTLAFEEARKDAPAYDASVVACEAHRKLARKAAEEAVTLLQNRDGFLPLSQSKKIILTGDLVNVENIGDHGSSQVSPPYITTLVQAIEKEYSNVDAVFIPTKQVSSRMAEIAAADAVVIVCGMSHGDEGEFIYYIGGDRKSLELHKKDLKLIDLISENNKNTAVVLMGGNVIMTHSWKDKVKAILFAYYTGMEGGGALADILFGKVNPSGKLPFAIAQKESDYPEIKWNTKSQFYGYYHGYQKLDKEGKGCDFPFGFGLSYTTFALENAALFSNDEERAIFSVDVTNTGAAAGAEVVQVYVEFPNSPVDRPVRALKGFERVALEPGEKKQVLVEVKKKELMWYDGEKETFVSDGNYVARIGTDEMHLGDAIPF